MNSLLRLHLSIMSVFCFVKIVIHLILQYQGLSFENLDIVIDYTYYSVFCEFKILLLCSLPSVVTVLLMFHLVFVNRY